jgi:hypothetical protein
MSQGDTLAPNGALRKREQRKKTAEALQNTEEERKREEKFSV